MKDIKTGQYKLISYDFDFSGIILLTVWPVGCTGLIVPGSSREFIATAKSTFKSKEPSKEIIVFNSVVSDS